MKRIYLEITNACNLNCPFCSEKKGNSYMSLNEISFYLEQIKPICNYLYLHVLGEPLLHPEFEQILALLDEKGFYVQLVTNGTLLYKYPNLLKHRCLRKLAISLHSVNNLNIDESYFDNINKLIENNDINIELRFYNQQNLDIRLSNYLKALNNRYQVSLSKKKDSYKIKDNVYIYYQDLFKWPNINDTILSNHGYCHGFIDQIAILHNGDVVGCCLDPNGHNLLGNLKKDTLVDILRSDKYQKIVIELKNHQINQELCMRCFYRLRFSKQ